MSGRLCNCKFSFGKNLVADTDPIRPIRTFSTAVTYYHKFRLVHKDTEYQFQDAAAAALFTACKIEDTLKKSKEILCAAYNLKVAPSEHLSSDDLVSYTHLIDEEAKLIMSQTFEGPSKIAIGIERLMLEASGFDFRVRYPQKHLIKLIKDGGIQKEVGKVAYNIMLDLYRTFAPIKQTCATMSFACIELATLICEKQKGWRGPSYKKWCTTRAEILETMLDLLDLYTHFQKSSIVGPLYNIEKFINIRIKLNQECEDKKLGRYTEYHDAPRTNGLRNVKTPKTPITPASPSDVRNGKDGASPATMSPRSASSSRRGIGARGQEGTVRFMLDAEQAKREKETVSEYFKNEFEDVEIEVEETIPTEPNHSHGHGQGQGQVRGPPRDFRSRDHRFDNKRMRR